MTIRRWIFPVCLLLGLAVPAPASPQEPAILLIRPSLVLAGLQVALSDAQLAVGSPRGLTLQASAYCPTDRHSEFVVLLTAPRLPAGSISLDSTTCTADTARLTQVLKADKRISHIIRATASVSDREIVVTPTWVLSEDGRARRLGRRTPPLARIPLTGLHLSTGDVGIGPVSVTVAFHASGALAATLLTGESDHPPRTMELDGLASGAANGFARIPISLLNRILADTRPSASLASNVGSIDLVDLQFEEVTAQGGGSLSGRAKISGTVFPFVLTFAGDNFTLSTIVITPPPNRCGPEPPENHAWMPWAVCTAKHDLAAAAASTLSTALTSRYRGEFLHPVFLPDPLVVRKEGTVLRLAVSNLHFHPLEGALLVTLEAIPLAK